jgi:hypothetical protein
MRLDSNVIELLTFPHGPYAGGNEGGLLTCLTQSPSAGVVAVDGMTAKQGRDDSGQPLHILNVFLRDIQAVIGQWSTGAEKTNEPTLLQRHLQELLETYPCLRLFTGDAIFAQRIGSFAPAVKRHAAAHSSVLPKVTQRASGGELRYVPPRRLRRFGPCARSLRGGMNRSSFAKLPRRPPAIRCEVSKQLCKKTEI